MMYRKIRSVLQRNDLEKKGKEVAFLNFLTKDEADNEE